MKKIIFVITSLEGGGAERMLVLILRGLDRNRYSPAVVVLHPGNAYLEDFPPDIPIICLNKKSRLDFFRVIWNLIRVIKQENPSLILSFVTYTNYLSVLACIFIKRRIPLLLREATNLTLSLEAKKFTMAKKILVRYLYPKANTIITVSKGIKDDLVTNYRIQEHKILAIYNSVDIERVKKFVIEEVNHPWFKEDTPVVISCGRLVSLKNYPLLLRAVHLVLKKCSLRVLILGEGKERPKLEYYAKKLGVSDNVCFLGFQNNPFKYMARADIFVLSSLWEGFGNVIIEAMACGIPVISTRCPSGPEEIIIDGVNGLLVKVGDAEEMAQAILKLLKDKILREKLVEAGRRRAKDFSLKKMAAKHGHLFEKWTS